MIMMTDAGRCRVLVVVGASLRQCGELHGVYSHVLRNGIGGRVRVAEPKRLHIAPVPGFQDPCDKCGLIADARWATNLCPYCNHAMGTPAR